MYGHRIYWNLSLLSFLEIYGVCECVCGRGAMGRGERSGAARLWFVQVLEIFLFFSKCCK